jgi:hypothetical protein
VNPFFLERGVIVSRNKKETVQFTKTITAGTTLNGANALAYLVKTEGTVERVFGKFYPGQQGALQVRPYILLTADRQEELVTYPNGVNRFMSGDDRVFDIPIDYDVKNGDQIKVDVSNTSAYDYTLEISFVLDYVGGGSRVI